MAVTEAQGIGFLGFIRPSDVRDMIAKVDADIATLDASVRTAPAMAPETLAAWLKFEATWAAYDKSVSLVPLLYLATYHDVVGFEERARAWEPAIKAARGGTLAGPSIQPEGPVLFQMATPVAGILFGAAAIGAAVYFGAPILARRMGKGRRR